MPDKKDGVEAQVAASKARRADYLPEIEYRTNPDTDLLESGGIPDPIIPTDINDQVDWLNSRPNSRYFYRVVGEEIHANLLEDARMVSRRDNILTNMLIELKMAALNCNRPVRFFTDKVFQATAREKVEYKNAQGKHVSPSEWFVSAAPKKPIPGLEDVNLSPSLLWEKEIVITKDTKVEDLMTSDLRRELNEISDRANNTLGVRITLSDFGGLVFPSTSEKGAAVQEFAAQSRENGQAVGNLRYAALLARGSLDTSNWPGADRANEARRPYINALTPAFVSDFLDAVNKKMEDTGASLRFSRGTNDNVVTAYLTAGELSSFTIQRHQPDRPIIINDQSMVADDLWQKVAAVASVLGTIGQGRVIFKTGEHSAEFTADAGAPVHRIAVIQRPNVPTSFAKEVSDHIADLTPSALRKFRLVSGPEDLDDSQPIGQDNCPPAVRHHMPRAANG